MDDLAVETVSLTRRFGAVLAVDRLDLAVPRQSVFAFLGPNGAGKTTTIRLLLGLIKPSAGQVRLVGQPLTPSSRQALARKLGALVESPALYPHLSGLENLRLTQTLIAAPSSRMQEVLRVVQLQHDAHRLVAEYSFGMRQRLGLALALLGEPELLILDEPTNGLDPSGIREMRHLIRRLAAEHGITVFLSSHLLGEVEQVASHVGIVGHGRLLFQGTLPDLQRQRRERALLEVGQPELALVVLRRAGWTVVETGEGRLRLEIAERADVPRAVAELVRAEVDVYQLSIERPSLEEQFLELTAGDVSSDVRTAVAA